MIINGTWSYVVNITLNNFEIKTTLSALKPVRAEAVKSEDAMIKDLLVNKFRLHEVHSYIWCDGKKYKKLGIDVENNVRILNIPTPENGTVRNSMISRRTWVCLFLIPNLYPSTKILNC